MDRIGDPLDRRLLNDWQRDFPVTQQPFLQIAEELDCSEQTVLGRLENLHATGRITRVGATCAPNTVSASTLAALAAPPEAIEEVAAIVGSQPGVNHSYLRENDWNLWFVATGPDREFVDASLQDIQSQTGLDVLDLRLVRPFNVDLGFKLNGGMDRPPVPRPVLIERLQGDDDHLLQALTKGMPIVSRPYKHIADELGVPESHVLDRVSDLVDGGIISRLGVIVRHRALGWSSNAMVVWDISSERIDAAGPALCNLPGVTLCYERRPVPGVWPYRLYCMIHAQSRNDALEVLEAAKHLPELAGIDCKVLFSSRCFKQTGALISRRGAAA
ncbi:AsnC family transcriptional regulator [Labrenzia sp. PHM005]|uniref:siroheme decarboxylase subunit beta n=1 Tax=Labrenzia sp. PHM005 TaxID=2590016 RepID=UPI00113FE4E2|nr:AsnC family transcriptional regulator [Labrenzia sp. PHM005]QDG79333.1 Lrp/AsnC family transcriptional regulator [Labrenzia sp. PHM005]